MKSIDPVSHFSQTRKDYSMKLLSTVIPLFLLCLNSVFGGTIVMITSDYQTGNTAVYDTETGVFSDNVLPVHQDSRLKTDGTYLYILEGFGADAISKYHPSSIKKAAKFISTVWVKTPIPKI